MAREIIQRSIKRTEKIISKALSEQTDMVQKTFGEKMGNEFVFSVVALLAGRSIAIIHLWTGEPIDSIRRRLNEALDHNVKLSLRKMMDTLSGEKE